MVLDDLGSSLRSTLDDLRGKSRISEEDVDEVVKEIQRSLIQADVDITLVQGLSESIKSRSLEEEPPAGTSPRDWVLRIVYEELVGLLGESTEIPLEEQTIMLAGLYGSGKTTTAAKMAWWFSKKGLRPAIIQTDTDDPVAIAERGLAETADADVRIVDTAASIRSICSISSSLRPSRPAVSTMRTSASAVSASPRSAIARSEERRVGKEC